MKHKLILTFLGLLLLCSSIFAQYCGTSGPSVCTTGNMTTPGITDYTTFPCVKSTVPYDEVVQVRFPDSLNQFGFNITILSVKIDSIVNLPCGLCWQCNSTSLSYAGGTNACIRISGTTTDVEGAYQIKMYGTATTTFGTQAGSLESLGFQLFLNVVGSADSCTPVNIQQLHSSCGNTGTAPALHPCKLDVEMSSSNPVTNCQFDSTTLTLLSPLGPGVKFTWVLLDAVNSTFVTDSVNVSFPVAYSPFSILNISLVDTITGCTDNRLVHLSTSGPLVPPSICYTTYDSSQSNGGLAIVFEKDNWFNNVSSYVVKLQRYNTGNAVTIGTVQPSADGYVVDAAPITYSNLSQGNVANNYSIQSNLVCGTNFSGFTFKPSLFGVNYTNTGYPLLVWTKSEPVNYDATYIFSRHVGGSWRLRLATTSVNDTSWIDLAPDTTQMEYMLGYLLNSNCDPSRAVQNMSFSNVGSIAVDPQLVVPDSTLNTSIQSQQNTTAIVAYPNPADTHLTIQCNSASADSDLDLKVYDVMGRIVIARNVNAVISTINISELNSGLYTVVVSNAGKTPATLRFIKN